MKQRCHNDNNERYCDYGGRGITVCEEWEISSKAFIEWGLSFGWSEGLTIDRIDNDIGYCPENCRFVTKAENNRNRRLIKSTNTSGFCGVYFNKKGSGHWMAYVKVDSKMKNIGYFDTKESAAIARDNYVIENSLGLPLNFER